MNTTRIRIIVMSAVAAVVFSSSLLYADFSGDKSCRNDKIASGRAEYVKKEPFKDLNLTDEQKKMLEDNKNKHREEMKTVFNEMKKNRDAMRQELQKEKLDMARITQINNDMKKMESEMSDRRLQGILEVRRILSPEQFRKFMSKMEKHMEHFKPKKD